MAFGARSFTKANVDFIALPNLPALTSAVSISYWYYHTSLPTAYPNRFCIFYGGNSNTTLLNYIVEHDGTGISLTYTTASSTYVTFSTTTSFDTGQWHNVVISSDFTTGGTKIYLDASSLSFATTGTPGSPSATNNLCAIGTLNTGSPTPDASDARLADIGLWSVQLSAGEAKGLSQGQRPNMVRQQSLKGYWSLDGVNSPEPDLTGNALNGVLTGTTNASGPPLAMRTPRQSSSISIASVFMRPDADFTDGSWLNELGTNTNLFASVDETLFSDSDYIQSQAANDKVRLRLSDPAGGAGLATPMTVGYRCNSINTSGGTIIGRLFQGSTQIATWSTTVNNTATNYTYTLSPGELSSITDPTDLYVEFEYSP